MSYREKNPGLYNPVTDKYYGENFKEEDPEIKRLESERLIKEELRNKEIAENLKAEKIGRINNYIDNVESLREHKAAIANREREDSLRRMEQEQNRKLQRKKDLAIEHAKERYMSKSFFYKLFHKQIDYFKRGQRFYNPDNMTIEEIDNLYLDGGRSR